MRPDVVSGVEGAADVRRAASEGTGVSSTLFSLHDPRVVLVDGVAADCSEH
jgi:hypothetical protein